MSDDLVETMNPEIRTYLNKFNSTLEPIKVMLRYKKDDLTYSDWIAFVERTQASILRNPDQYLGPELPEKESLDIIVKTIFRNFLDHVH
jgi:hypothetical protein